MLLLSFTSASCQEKYREEPYDDFEKELRAVYSPQKLDKLVLDKYWEKRDSLTYLRFKNIETIFLYETDSIPPWITKYKKLQVLYNSSNSDIKVIPENIGNLSNLENLILNTSIEHIPISIWNLNNLRALELRGGEEIIVPSTINSLKKLEWLSLEGFKSVPNEIFELENLKSLYLMNCNVSVLPSTINNLKKLEWLSLKGNPLEYLPEELFELPNLCDFSYDEDKIKDENLKKRIEGMLMNNKAKYYKKLKEEMQREYREK